VVVMDVQLQDGSGLEVMRLVREVAPDVAFIVFSSHSEPEYRKRYLAAGALVFLDKSTEFDQLPGAIRGAALALH
jgi:DNA-binding NarL/FixJ family response regulator